MKVRAVHLLFFVLFLIVVPFKVNADDFGLDYVRQNYIPVKIKDLTSLKNSLNNNQDNEKIYLEISRKTFDYSLKSIPPSLSYYIKAILSYIKKFDGKRNIFVLFLLSLIISVFLTSLVFAISRLTRDLNLFVHEITESPSRLLYFLVLIPAIFDFRLLIFSLLFLVSIHTGRKDRFVTLTLILLNLFAVYLFDFSKAYIFSVNSATGKSVTLVNTNRSNIPAMLNLASNKHFEEGFSHALSYLKEKHYQKSLKLYNSLSQEYTDPRIDVNRGFLLAKLGMNNQAEKAFKRALETRALASAYYNLSILSADKLKFKEADDYFSEAVKLDFGGVTRFREKHKGSSILSLMYEQLNDSELFGYTLNRALKNFNPTKYNLYISLYALFVFLFIAFFSKRYKHRAIKCPKCGQVYCMNCERRIYWNGLCKNCYTCLVSFEADPSDRVRVILKSYEFTRKQKAYKTLMSFLIPGFLLMRGDRLIRPLTLFCLCILPFRTDFVTCQHIRTP